MIELPIWFVTLLVGLAGMGLALLGNLIYTEWLEGKRHVDSRDS